MKKPSKNSYNQSAMAAAIGVHFKISCSRQSLQNWQKWEPPFPAADAGGRYLKEECFDWIKTVYLPKGAHGAKQTDLFIQEREAEASIIIDRAKQERVKAEAAEGKYIDRTEARQKTIGALRRYHSFVVTELENNLPFDAVSKLKDAGATPDVAALFFDWITGRYQRAIDRIEKRCADEEKEADAISI